CLKLLPHFGEAFRFETLRVLPVLGRMVHAVNEHNDGRSPGYIEIPCVVICESHSVDHPARSRTPAEPCRHNPDASLAGREATIKHSTTFRGRRPAVACSR